MSNAIRSILLLLLIAVALPAADLAGIWAGQAPGRQGEMEDVAFSFNVTGQQISGKMFGDEFDLPIEGATVSGDHVRFIVVTTNYYSGTKNKFLYTGVLMGNEMELTRERILSPGEKAPENGGLKRTFKVKKLTS
ncbi:MAG TPA: hypothetical protein VE621_15010 [Bryobacteraceae bacterium]|jgi:hypothetical protein|nr:hypothetical protein [Bryobacteraceae bacterium]